MNVDLTGADLTGAEFTGAITDGTNFEGVIGTNTRPDGRKSTDS